jgi:ubiquinone/menaquinone biosynthesis C-methylase UbiE
MLHLAPEPVFENLLKHHLGSGYLTADLCDPRAMVKMDITDIQYPDESFDVIYCSHVLQYVPDDKQALREFFRVLTPDGWAILLVPPITDRTFEYLSITDQSEHLKTYDQPYDTDNPVRRYGANYVEKLKEAGFKVKVTHPSDLLSKEEIVRMGITRAGEIYYCTKK